MSGVYHYAVTYYLPRSMGGDVMRPWCHAKKPGYDPNYRLTTHWRAVGCTDCLAMLDGAPAPEFRFGRGGPKPRKTTGPFQRARRVRTRATPPNPPAVPLIVPTGPSLMELAVLVADAHGLTVEDLTGRAQAPYITHPRQEAMWLMRQQTRPDGRPLFSYPKIGRFFGRDHATVIHGCEAVEGRLATQMAKAA